MSGNSLVLDADEVNNDKKNVPPSGKNQKFSRGLQLHFKNKYAIWNDF